MPFNPVFTPVDNNGLPLASVAVGNGTSNLVTAGASTVTTFLTYVSTSHAAADGGDSFATTGVSSLAIDITLSSFTGGSTPAVTFFVDRFGADGVWYRVWTSSALNTATTVSANIGPGQSGTGNVSAVLTALARFGWSSTGSPTGITFDASVIGR